MKKVVDRKFFKPFLLLLMVVLISFNISPMLTKASSSELIKAVEEADEEIGMIILESLEFNENKTAFVGFDEEYAKSKGLNEENLVNIEVFFDLDDEAFTLFKNVKLELENEGDQYSIQKVGEWKATVKLVAVITAMAFVGKALITQIVNDLYRLGVTKFCKSKWSKSYKVIRSTCKDMGYPTS